MDNFDRNFDRGFGVFIAVWVVMSLLSIAATAFVLYLAYLVVKHYTGS